MNFRTFFFLLVLILCCYTGSRAQDKRTPVLIINPPDSLMVDRFVINFTFDKKLFDSLENSVGADITWYLLPDPSSGLVSFFARGSIFRASCPFVANNPTNTTFMRILPFEFSTLPSRNQFFLQAQVTMAQVFHPFTGLTNIIPINLPLRSVVPTVPILSPPRAIRQQAFTILWNKVFGTNTRTDTTLYLVEVDTSDLFTAPRVFTTRDTSQIIAGLRPATRYFYRVKARNSAGESRFSSSTSYSTLKASANYAIDTPPFLQGLKRGSIFYFYTVSTLVPNTFC